ncbi:hypothetical protein MKJ04_09545 [Pontibacter sp. E15-1]|uniref:hypothetical protein n=1 Tax=Pontibacter sp. E15-1 TaxID=2919918 RepID=UPI001F503A6E|nr:hypothetical protein [Pontibacter sp. E15-1]MCJ8165087.1 hypothetical protein [Pontibacter sp. E15-1]
MKKIVLGCALLLGFAGLAACESTERSDATVQDNKVVVDRDSVATEYEVTETVVEYDTTTRTKTVDADHDE